MRSNISPSSRLRPALEALEPRLLLSDVVQLVPEGAPVTYHVPTVEDAGIVTAWPATGFDDSAWASTTILPSSTVLITEACTGAPDYVEVQNVSDSDVDTSGWVVALNDARYYDINDVEENVWSLPGTMGVGEVLYREDSTGDHYWGSNIYWNTSGNGWAMIVDDEGAVADFVVWGYSEAEIVSLNVNIAGFNITAGDFWIGSAVSAGGTSDNSLSRQGNTDNDDASDFAWGSQSKGAQNASLVTPFPGGEMPATTGVGFDITGAGYSEAIRTDVQDEMWNVNPSLWIRIPFGMTDNPVMFDELTLKMKYDDGFVAYLNGQEIARRNAPASLAWISSAETERDHADALVFEDIDVSADLGLLQAGTNVLAIHGLNYVTSDSELLILPELWGTKSDFEVSATDPPDGAIVSSAPTQIVVDFSDDVLVASLDATDLTVGGQAAIGFAVLDGDTVRFDLPAGIAIGTYEVAIADAAIQSAVGKPIMAYSGQLSYYVPPSVTSLPATGVGHTYATLNGSVIDTGGDDPEVHIAWGPSDAGTELGTWYGEVILGTQGIGPFSTQITRLYADTTYYYRAFAINAAGTTWAPATLSLLTGPAQAPSAQALPATNITQTSATLNGRVPDNGGEDPEVHFVWGDEDAGQTPGDWDHDVNLGVVGIETFATVISGLETGASYYFSVYATNSAGTAWAPAVQTFEPLRDQPIITEFMASNANTLQAQYGSDPYPDWIELHNPTDAPVNLDGWYLTDNDGNLTKWRIPAVTLSAGDYMVVFASSLDRTITSELHTNFNLGASGEYVALVRPDGTTVVSEYTFGQQRTDISYGLSLDYSEEHFFAGPTPGAANTGAYWDVVGDTTFSVDRGFFENPFYVTISTDTPGATIRYTLDGSKPTGSYGTVYSGPVYVETTATLRAIAYKAGMYSSNVDTQTYIFLDDVLTQDGAGLPTTWVDRTDHSVSANYGMDPSIVAAHADTIKDDLLSIPTISLVMEWDDWFDQYTGIYANPDAKNDPGAGEDWEHEVSVEYILPDSSDDFQLNAGVRIQGGYVGRNLSHTKHSLRLDFRSEYGASKLNYPLIPLSDVQEFDTIVLRAGGNDQSLMVRDEFGRQVQHAMGQPSPVGTWVHLYINGLYWGLYNPIERPDHAFSADHNGGEKEEYDVIKKTGRDGVETVNGDRSVYNTTLTLADRDLSNPSNYAALQQYIDMVNVADHMIMEFHVGNRDWPGNNWYVSRRDASGEKWMFLPWDVEYGMFLDGSTHINVDLTGAGETSSMWMLHVIHWRALANAEYRMLFADRVYKHFANGGVLSPDGAEALFLSICDEMERAIICESARWNNPSSYSTWLAQRNQILNDWLPVRADIVIEQLRARDDYPDIDPPTLSRHGGEVPPGGVSITMTNPNGSGTVYYTLDGSDPRLVGGAVSGSALVYSGGSIVIDSETVVKSRVLSGGEWSALNEADFVVTPGELRITEVMYNPPAPAAGSSYAAQDFEYVEFYNDGPVPLEVGGITFDGDDPVRFTFPAGTTIPAYGRVLIVANQLAFEERYGAGLPVVGQYVANLGNGGDDFALRTALGAEVITFSYDDAGDWPGRADGRGFSLQLVDSAGDYNDPENWRSSTEFGGSPGTAGAAPCNDVTITEVLTHTDPPAVDAVELRNNTTGDIDIGGWYLSDANNPGAESDYMKYQIPAGTILPAGGYIVFDESHFNPTPGSPLPNHFAFSGAHGDDVWLLTGAPSGVGLFVDHAKFGAAANGVSFGRYSTGAGATTAQAAVTLGELNSYPLVGPVVISEIMYDPTVTIDDSDLEYVELYNRSDSTVNLWVNHGGTDYGWWLEGAVDFEFAPGTSIATGQTLLVVRFDPSETDLLNQFAEHYGVSPTIDVVGGWSGRLSDDGERVKLLWPDEPPVLEPGFVPYIVTDEVEYGIAPEWPDASANGMSLHRKEAWLFGDDAANWRAAAASPTAADFIGWAPPTVASHTVTGTPVSQVSVTFTGDVSGSVEAGDLVLLNQTTGEYVDTAAAGFAFAAGTATWTLAPLADGEYRARISADAVRHALSGYPLDGDGDSVGGDDYAFMFTSSSALPGDADGDGDVDLDDVFTVRNNFGLPGGWTDGDFDGDGMVNLEDLFTVRNNFGVGMAAAGAGSPAVLVQAEAQAPMQAGAETDLVAAHTRAGHGAPANARSGPSAPAGGALTLADAELLAETAALTGASLFGPARARVGERLHAQAGTLATDPAAPTSPAVDLSVPAFAAAAPTTNPADRDDFRAARDAKRRLAAAFAGTTAASADDPFDVLALPELHVPLA